MEIYGINAFEPQVGPWETYMIYFRPMSLTKGLAFKKKQSNRDKSEKSDTIDIAPSTISKNELEVRINGKNSEIVNITKTLEYSRGTYIYGYLVQAIKPKKDSESMDKYDKITIVLKSDETGEYGKGEYFIKRKELLYESILFLEQKG